MSHSEVKSVTTYLGVAHPWMCDAMGHMNVRHYVGMFDDASFQLLGRVTGVERDRSRGWADVRQEIEYRHETPSGALVTILSSVLRVGRSSITYRHSMVGSLEGELHAEAIMTSVRFDLAARKSVEIDAAVRRRAEALIAG